MAEAGQSSESAVRDSFNAHLQTFYEGLPTEEQALLQQIVQLAAGAEGGEDTQGYIIFVGGAPQWPPLPASSPRTWIEIESSR